jgi:para-nitrobenzyl esterase
MTMYNNNNNRLVTVYGQSSGGTSILALLAAPSARGLFSRAWLMSSSWVFDVPLSQAERDNTVFVEHAKCTRNYTTLNEIDCLYDLSTSAVLNAVPLHVFPWWAGDMLMDLPVPGWIGGALAIVDGEFIPQPPADVFRQGRGNDVAVVFGTTAQVRVLTTCIVFSYMNMI